MLDSLSIKNPMAGPKKLRELVRDIRSAKTAAEERAIVNKECAEIRHSFRSENSTYRCRNVAKLLYIHMLGYPAHFGQLECLKLIASPRFTDKRVGHLGAMLLLDEKTDVHLLLTNSLKNDLNHSTPYVVSLALCTLGSICSAEICRDLAGEVERIIRSQNIYLKKKATLCAFRILKKVPDLLELFIPCTRNILAEKNHSVLLATVCLISEMCILSKEVLNHFRKETDLIPTLIRTMRNLVLVNYTNDSDVNRVSDPFLQVKILRLMRILGHGDRIVSDQLNDILTQVATNTETTKNVGHAILYEIVLTIMGIESDSGLKVLAINILGRFLLNSEKNIRYVALNTLKQVVHGDYQSVQRHRATILDCLKDPDASIRRRAIDLCFALINSSNIVHIMREILLYLSPKGLCEDDSKGDVCFNSLIACDMYAPNPKWLFEVILQMLLIVGNHAREDVVSSIISVVSQMNTEMHAYAVHNLYYAISSGEFHRQPLLQAAAWIIGEYGDLLVKPMQLTRNEEMQKSLHIVVPDAIYERFETHPTETQVIEILEKSLISSLCSNITKQMIVISLGKLSSRFTEVHLNKITSLVNHYSSSLNIELQQRSVELKMILTDSKSLRDGLLELMPVIESKMMANEENATADSNNILADDSDMSDLVDIIGNVCDRPLAANTNSVADNIFDQIIGMVNEDNGPTILPIANANPATNGQQNNDLLDIFGFDNGPNIERNIDSNPSKYPQTFASMKIFENSHLSIDLLPVRLNEAADNDIKLTITLRSPYSSVDAFELLVAVPKNLKLNLLPPSATRMTTSQPSITQEMNIVNSNKNTVKLRIKLSYQAEGLSKTEQFQVDSFPIQLWIN